MNLKRQLLIVSLLTLVLPWAGCQFVAETESALRTSQQQMLAGTARAIADTLSQYAHEFPPPDDGPVVGDQLFAHTLNSAPAIDGYYNDWGMLNAAMQSIRGPDGPIRYALGINGASLYLFVDVPDDDVIYSTPGVVTDSDRYADRVSLVNIGPNELREVFVFGAEAPGPIVTYLQNAFGPSVDNDVRAHWQDYPGGFRVEARIPTNRLGTRLGLVIDNTTNDLVAPVRSATYAFGEPGLFVTASPTLTAVAENLSHTDLRLTVTDAAGWRIATAGELAPAVNPDGVASTWLRIAYESLLESGEDLERAAPDPGGREQQLYVRRALAGEPASGWFQDAASDRAIVAVAQPISTGGEVIGAVIVQQGTEAVLSLTNDRLTNLLYTTVGVTLLVAIALLGYASWLSRRIRRLSRAAENAVDSEDLRRSLPSALDGDEVGDLSRSFAHVLGQLGEYNDYLRTLASKLSHELRTPLAIVSSSLENLEHEPLSEDAAGYTARAKHGAARLRRILTAMSEASRVEELMSHAEFSTFDLGPVIHSAVDAYRDIYPQARFSLGSPDSAADVHGSPELLIQMLDKIVSNAVDFATDSGTISIQLQLTDDAVALRVHNPGPPLPERMRERLFDSMVSMRDRSSSREDSDGEHLGLGLYVSRLIAEGHGGSIHADNVDDGVEVSVRLPLAG